MPLLPYLTDEQVGDSPLVAAIRQRRGGGLLNLDRQLMYSPPFAQGWNALLGTVRTGLSVDPRLRELAMCVVAVLNVAEYEYIHHAPEFVKAGGTQAQIETIRTMESVPIEPAMWSEVELATIALAKQMTRIVEVEPSTLATLRRHLDAPQVVELVGVVAAYNMVSRFLVALGVEPE